MRINECNRNDCGETREVPAYLEKELIPHGLILAQGFAAGIIYEC